MSNDTANLLIEYELLISALYTVCAKHFPQTETFWKDLSAEEVIHADTIRELLAEVDGRKLKLNAKRFNIRPLEISMEYAKEITKRVEDKELDLLGALSLALDIETSVIESKFYELFEGASRDYSTRLKSVRDESRRHASQIREMKQQVYENPGEYS